MWKNNRGICGNCIFTDSIFDSVNIYNQKTPWYYSIGDHEPLQKASELILTQYLNLAKRLGVLYRDSEALKIKYGKDFSSTEIENDIKYLSRLGIQLLEPTKKFLKLAKEQMIKLDVVATRTKAMQGLATFNKEIEIAHAKQSESLENTINQITMAVNNLEKAINE